MKNSNARARAALGSIKLRTVTGILRARDVKMTMAHEHMFTDFCGPDQDAYMDVNWSNKIGAAVESAAVLRGQGVNLVVEWTNIGIGRNVLALRSVSRQSDVHFVCPTGIYKDLKSPVLANVSIAAMTGHFISELATGIDGTGIRTGFVKTSCNESGATRKEVGILRAAARRHEYRIVAIFIFAKESRHRDIESCCQALQRIQ